MCKLCTARAANEGWIREGLADTPSVRSHARERRGGSLLRRLRERASRPELQPLDGDLNPVEPEAAAPDPEPYVATAAPRAARPGATSRPGSRRVSSAASTRSPRTPT